MNDQIRKLKQDIIALASQGKEIHTQIIQLRSQPDTGKQREGLWTDKRAIGTQARCRLLAYAYLRGVPYSTVEANAVPGNIPYVWAIAPHVHPGFDKLPLGEERKQIAAGIRDWLGEKVEQEPAEASSASTEAA